jgi:hypothetical protein
VRYNGDKAAVAAAIRAAVKEVAPGVPLLDIRTMNELIGESMITERAISQMAAFLGLLAFGRWRPSDCSAYWRTTSRAESMKSASAWRWRTCARVRMIGLPRSH